METEDSKNIGKILYEKNEIWQLKLNGNAWHNWMKSINSDKLKGNEIQMKYSKEVQNRVCVRRLK